MIFRCRSCNAFLGIGEPIEKWGRDRSIVCSGCLEKEYGKVTTELLSEETASHGPSADDRLSCQDQGYYFYVTEKSDAK